MSRFLRIAAGIAIVAGLVTLPFLLSGTEAASTNVSVIVELRDDPGAVYAAKLRNQGAAVSNDQIQTYEQSLQTTQDRFLTQLAAAGTLAQVQSVTVSNVTIQIRYAHVYNGISLSVPSSSLATIKAMPQVKAVHANTRLYTTLDKSVPYIDADDRTYGSNNNRFTPNSSLDGNEGQATFVAIIDTGIDWRHAMFGGDPTPPRLGVAPPDSANVHTNQKIVYSLPLADIAVEDGFGHGTHVASTVAGYLANAPGPDGLPLTGDEIPIHGVAPQAKLMSYKVCSDVGSTLNSVAGVAVPVIGGCDTSNIVMAIEDATKNFTVTGFAKPKADVINMSLGGGGGPDEPTAVASDNAVLDGVTVVAAAGNSGPGEATLGSPAAGTRVIAVAANTDPGSHYSWAVDALDASSFPQSQTGAVTPASSFGMHSCIDRIKVFAMAGTPTPPDAAMAQYYALVDDPTVAWPASVAGRMLHVPLHAAVAQLTSSSGRVTVRNADNSQSGVGAFWDYSNNIGADNLFSAGETSTGRTLSFNNPNNESFTVSFSVTASAPYSGPTCCAPTNGSGSSGGASGGSGISNSSPSISKRDDAGLSADLQPGAPLSNGALDWSIGKRRTPILTNEMFSPASASPHSGTTVSAIGISPLNGYVSSLGSAAGTFSRPPLALRCC